MAKGGGSQGKINPPESKKWPLTPPGDQSGLKDHPLNLLGELTAPNNSLPCKILKKKYFSCGQKSKKELKSESPQGTCKFNKYF